MILTIDDFKYNLYENKFKIFVSIDKYLMLLESDQNNTFEWDLTKDIEDDISIIKDNNLGLNSVKKYIIKILERIGKLSTKLKMKIFKFLVVGFISIISLTDMLAITTTYYETNTEIESGTLDQFKDIITKIYNDSIKKEYYNKPTTYSTNLINFLKLEEGSIKHKSEPVLTAYKIGDGMVTIGYGHAERTSKTKMIPGLTTITKEQANNLLIKDIKDAQNGLDIILNKWKKKNINFDITQGMYDSMISMIFNMGIGNFRRSDFIKLLKHGKYDEAQVKILTTNVSYPGHVKRRQKELNLFES